MAQTENKTPKMALKEAGMGKYVTGDSESPQKSLLPLPRLNSPRPLIGAHVHRAMLDTLPLKIDKTVLWVSILGIPRQLFKKKTVHLVDLRTAEYAPINMRCKTPMVTCARGRHAKKAGERQGEESKSGRGH